MAKIENYKKSKMCMGVLNRIENGDGTGVRESEWTYFLVLYAQSRGWLVQHLPDSRKLIGDAGMPDLVMWREGICILAELKTNKGRVSKEQDRWRRECPKIYRVWRPKDWLKVKRVLNSQAMEVW